MKCICLLFCTALLLAPIVMHGTYRRSCYDFNLYFVNLSRGCENNVLLISSFQLKDCQQETESNASCNTVYPASLGPNCYYTVGETSQRKIC